MSAAATLVLGAFATLALVPTRAPAQNMPTAIIWREVAPGGWRWLEDYAFLSATYRVGCPRDRKCRIGTGVFVGGSPRGGEKDFSGDIEVSVFELGALHVQVLDGDAPARVGFYRQSQMLIPIYPPPGL